MEIKNQIVIGDWILDKDTTMDIKRRPIPVNFWVIVHGKKDFWIMVFDCTQSAKFSLKWLFPLRYSAFFTMHPFFKKQMAYFRIS